MDRNIPIPDSPLSGHIMVDNYPIRPADEIRIPDEKHYIILSSYDNVEMQTYDLISDQYELLSKDQLSNIVTQDNAYHWSLGIREYIQIENTLDTLCLWIFAPEHHQAKNQRYIFFGWSVTEQKPVKFIPKLDGYIRTENMHKLLDEIQPSSGKLDELYDIFRNDIKEPLEWLVKVADYNLRVLFDNTSNPTYTAEEEKLINMDTISLKDYQSLANEERS